MTTTRITLDQWQVLCAVVEAGSYARAAKLLRKSQSALTYAVQKLESLLGVRAFTVRGRRAVLTPAGEQLYRRARVLLDDAARVERGAASIAQGWEPIVRLAVEVTFPRKPLLDALARLGVDAPETRIELFESVLGGTEELLIEGAVDLAILPRVPSGFLGAHLTRIDASFVAHRDHPLHALGRPLTMRDLRAHRQIVIRESGRRRTTPATVEATLRWTVTSAATAIDAVRAGHGYCWAERSAIATELSSGSLVPLRLEKNSHASDLFLVHADRDVAGPGVLRMAALLREEVRA
ncbi:MAG: LysR family transcriptional regulator [Labilithrix sp.]|nr:LysR family transcriptional regulator [Labilithrix sp.]MBX3218359.1 LysR family transcriptional regulator [Labilithrix sp.]